MLLFSICSKFQVETYPTFPSKICTTCKELVEATFALKIMYEKTSEVLRNLLRPYEELEIKVEEEDCENDCFENSTIDEDEVDNIQEENQNNDTQQEEEQIIIKLDDVHSDLQEDQINITLSTQDRLVYKKRKKYSKVENNYKLLVENKEKLEGTLNLKNSQGVNHFCSVCFSEFTNALEFRKHIKTHKVYKMYLKGKLNKIFTY